MRLILLFFFTLTTYLTTSAQFVAKMEIKEPIPGLCNKQDVYALIPGLKGQVQAQCSLTKEQINDRLNSEIQFLKDNPDYNDKGMIGLIINCKGELVQCKMDNKTKSQELDSQIEKVFNSLGEWTAGKLNKKNVDTSRLFSFKIENGRISIN
jgi:hypothetical protein